MEYDALDQETSYLRFQNNIQSIFNRVRLLYGATPIEDIPYYNVIVRKLTEWTTSSALDQTSINEGIGGVVIGATGIDSDTNPQVTTTSSMVPLNARQKYIHGIDFTMSANLTAGPPATVSNYSSGGSGKVPNSADGASAGNSLDPISGFTGSLHPNVKKGNPIRRYQVQLMLGIFNQEKLIPTKFMASQLAIEITLESATACMYYQPSIQASGSIGTFTTYGKPQTTAPTYRVKNVNLIPEILEFDASYDESFLMGLQTGGVPIKFSTWNNYRFSNTGVSSINLQIQERSRSVKAIFAMLRRDPPTIQSDSGASFFNTASVADGASTFQEYQFRIGGR